MLPATAKDILSLLILEHFYSIATLAKETGISRVTLRRIQRGRRPSRKIDIQLLQFYCCLKS